MHLAQGPDVRFIALDETPIDEAPWLGLPPLIPPCAEVKKIERPVFGRLDRSVTRSQHYFPSGRQAADGDVFPPLVS
jgi:hypothetical protein